MRFPSTTLKGSFYVKKDFNLEKHLLLDVPNLQVINLLHAVLQSLTFLNLPSEIVRGINMKSVKPMGPNGVPGGDCDCPRGPPSFEGGRQRFGERNGYHGGPRGGKGDFAGDMSGGPPKFLQSFRGNCGRPRFGRSGGGEVQDLHPLLSINFPLSFVMECSILEASEQSLNFQLVQISFERSVRS
ncbi:hypothetical protein GIB67_038031 [Kingdonia uniflora]|uniref:Uncharacterized protein n=1 Tax=Kingdonia uniflora TaxID=39325 RepID=A0A7J7MCE4_9MAGN|nr:hypothetical protein GIB67_038031 [Kingdonia uniflora]